MNAVTTTDIRSAFALKSAGSKRSKSQWSTVFFQDVMDSKVRMGLSRKAGEMLYAINWADRTGRTAATVSMALRKLTAYEFAKLLADVCANCSVMADVPAYLSRKFAA